ncbi:MAG: hypothetical protein AAGJ46_06030 [Planctomycetota bacterium]
MNANPFASPEAVDQNAPPALECGDARVESTRAGLLWVCAAIVLGPLTFIGVMAGAIGTALLGEPLPDGWVATLAIATAGLGYGAHLYGISRCLVATRHAAGKRWLSLALLLQIGAGVGPTGAVVALGGLAPASSGLAVAVGSMATVVSAACFGGYLVAFASHYKLTASVKRAQMVLLACAITAMLIAASWLIDLLTRNNLLLVNARLIATLGFLVSFALYAYATDHVRVRLKPAAKSGTDTAAA